MLSQIYTGKIYPHVLIMDSSISFLWNSISVFTLHCVAINTCCRKKSRSCLLVKSMIFCLKIRKKVGNLILYLIYTCFVCISDKKMLWNLTNISSTPDKGQSQTNKRVDKCGLFHYESYILGCQNDSWQTRIYHFRLPKDRFSSWKYFFFLLLNCFAFRIIKLLRIQDCHRPRWLSWMRVRLETRRWRVRPPPRSATFFRGDWSWNIFYGHSLPSADSRRAVVSFWRKNVHNTGKPLRGLSLPSKCVVR